MRNMIYTNNSSASAVTANSAIPLGSAVHGYGKGIRLVNNGIEIRSCGYYEVEVSVTATQTTATDTFTVQLYKDGVAIPGALASATGTVIDLTIPYVIRRGCEPSSVYTVVSTLAGTINDVSVVVKELV